MEHSSPKKWGGRDNAERPPRDIGRMGEVEYWRDLRAPTATAFQFRTEQFTVSCETTAKLFALVPVVALERKLFSLHPVLERRQIAEKLIQVLCKDDGPSAYFDGAKRTGLD